MKRFRRRRRSVVRWLPDNSQFSQFSTLRMPTPTASTVTSSINLLALSGGYPQALLPSGAAGAVGLSRMDTDALILDHIVGKMSFNIESNGGGEGDADATGIWRYFVRMAIFIRGTASDPSSVAADALEAGGNILGSLDPSADVPWLQQGSFVPDGLRRLWTRNWFLSIDWEAGAQATGTLVSNEDACPPGPYVDIRPKRLLRANEQLIAALQCNTFIGPGAGGTSGIIWGPDIRVAAHNTMRRR